jgi:hypothetical protein
MAPVSNLDVTKVHIVFKTHLDVGFTDFAANVKRQYMESFIPAAMRMARELRERGGLERFVWTTGSWLIYEYLESATPRRRKEMEQAIAAGDIAWHGLPFTVASELLDASLFRFGLSLSRKLDARFGKRTFAAKMTDVPGHTRAIVPLLAEAGIQFLHIGVNPASTAPDVPDAFVWQHFDGSEVVVMYEKAYYGATRRVPGMSSALAIAHTNDNLGPNDPDEIARIYAGLREQFPNAQLVASRLDDYAEDLLAVRAQLPVVTQEMGDTWIHGAGTDPRKVAQYRELCRLRNEWQKAGRVKEGDKRFERFSRFLLCVPEHTWGMDEKLHLGDYEHYSATGLKRLRRTAACKRFEASWAEQRAYITQAVEALGSGPLAGEAKERLNALTPAKPSRRGMRRVAVPEDTMETAHFEIAFDPAGAICHLRDMKTGRRWADARHTLGLFRYETFSAADYARFGRQYIRNWPHPQDWAIKDFTKPGMEATGVEHALYLPILERASHQSTRAGDHFLLELRMPDVPASAYGCPRQLVVELLLPAERPEMNIAVQWFHKQACRLPEAIWYTFNPRVAHPDGWALDKMGEPISPLDVVRDGGRKLHAIDSGVYYAGDDGACRILSADAPLVAPGEPALLQFDNRQPPLRKGMHFNLYNNIWGTNFPMWYDEDAAFMFRVVFD